MSTPLLIIVTLIYAGIAIDQAWNGNVPMMIVFACYAGANIGLIMGVS